MSYPLGGSAHTASSFCASLDDDARRSGHCVEKFDDGRRVSRRNEVEALAEALGALSVGDPRRESLIRNAPESDVREALRILEARNSVLKERGDGDLLRDAMQDGSSFMCPRCEGVIAVSRRDFHAQWCPAWPLDASSSNSSFSIPSSIPVSNESSEHSSIRSSPSFLSCPNPSVSSPYMDQQMHDGPQRMHAFSTSSSVSFSYHSSTAPVVDFHSKNTTIEMHDTSMDVEGSP